MNSTSPDSQRGTVARSEHLQAVVPDSHRGLRLDQSLARLFPDYSRSRLQQWIKEGGVTLDDCVLVNNEAGPVIDVEDLIQSPYTLEVSSPGLNRALKKERDFERFKDRSVKIRTHDAVGTRRNFRGRLLGCKKGLIKIEVDGHVLDIPLSNVAHANLELEL